MASTDERNFILKYPIKITYDKDATYESCAPSLKDPFYGMREMPENIRQVYQDLILRLDLDQKDVPYVTLSNEFGGIATSYDEVKRIF